MAINKVKFGNQTLIDLTDTTATADKILTGFGAYGKDGVWMNGAYEPNLTTKTVTPKKTTQIITPDVIDETTIISQALSSYGGRHKVTSGGSWYTDVALASGQGSRFTSFPMSIHLYIYFRSQGVMSGGNSYMRGADTKIDLTVTLPSENYSVEIPVSSTYIKKIVLEPYSSSNKKPRIYIYDPDSFSTSNFYVYIRNADASFPQYGWSSAPYDNAFRIYPVEQYDGLSQVTVNGDTDLIASNIKSGVEIFGVTGTYQADTGAVADSITQLQGGGDWHNVYGVDLTQDTVAADKLLSGYTAHNSAGNAITGTYEGGGGDFSTATVTLINNVAWPGPSIIATGAIVEDDPDFPLSVINAWCSTGATNAIQVIMFKGRAEIKVEEENSSTATITYTGSCEPSYGGTYIVTGDCTFTMAR